MKTQRVSPTHAALTALLSLTLTLAPRAYADDVTALILVDASTGEDLQTLTAGSTVNLGLYPTSSFSARATTDPFPTGSVRFDFNGTNNFQTENVPPYALGGDTNGVFSAVDFPLGANTITATAYTGGNAGGDAGPPLTIDFTVIDVPTMAPEVDAGSDQSVILPDSSVTLSGSASDDG
ncbi:MAG: hypothetical protein AAFX85_13200, partial [Pseudomonadota bacterium]